MSARQGGGVAVQRAPVTYNNAFSANHSGISSNEHSTYKYKDSGQSSTHGYGSSSSQPSSSRLISSPTSLVSPRHRYPAQQSNGINAASSISQSKDSDQQTRSISLTTNTEAVDAAGNRSADGFGGGGSVGEWTSTQISDWAGGGSSNGMGRSGSRSNGLNSEGGEGGDGNDGRESPNTEAEKDRAAKKANPLVDLIETETAYVSELSKIIKKVAGAWSRSNFPPAELDTMFRNVESIYRVNRSFLKSLKEIGPNPSSPRALGDLLMRWIDDLEAPYQRYCDNYFTDFDNWSTVQNNVKLPLLLTSLTEAEQSSGSPVIYSDKKRQLGQSWTLDQLFALPQTRLKYYKKLYARLLKSTQSGRSDHRLLVGANEKLDELLQRAKRRIAMSVLDDGPIAPSGRQSQESSLDNTPRTLRDSSNGQGSASSRTSYSVEGMKMDKENSIPPALLIPERSYSPLSLSPMSNTSMQLLQQQKALPVMTPPKSNQQGAASIFNPASHLTDSSLQQNSPERIPSPSASDNLEHRLDTSRTQDIFSLKPKSCQLRMNPPNIPFTRSVRKSSDVVIYFTPSSTGQELIFKRAHIFLLTDLFLVCERMTAKEQAERGGSAEMWLLYPPLAGKHLMVSDNGAAGNSISVLILKKETLTIHLESREAKVDWLHQFDQCNKFATNLGLKVKTSSEPDVVGKEDSSSLMPTSRDARSVTPILSPAISVTPSSTLRTEEDDTSVVKDTTKLLDEMAPFSPEEGDLSRVNSFNSFVMPPLHQPVMIGDGKEVNRGLGLLRNPSPEALSPPFPANRFNGNNRPAPPLNNSFSSQGSGGSATMSPPMLSNKVQQFQGARPGMSFGAPPPPPLKQGGPPAIPSQPPPAHLLNGVQGRMPPRPPPPQQMNGGPMGFPGRPQQPQPRPAFQHQSQPGVNNAFPPSTMQGRPPRPPSQEPNRRPSAPDLRSRAQMQDGGRSTSEEGPPLPGRSRSASSAHSGPPKLPSDFLKQAGSRPKEDYSPPSSPKAKNKGPKTSVIAAQMRCRLYLKQSHAQWKSLGNARIKVYHLMPDDVKQLVVENDKKQTPIISSIVLADGVERVGKVGVAIELSDNGNRTGIVYMVHLRSEESAAALFGQLLEGSDRTVMGAA